MGLRVPNTILFLKSVSNLSRASFNLLKAQTVVGSGKRIEKLSDDPTGAIRLLGLNSRKLDLQRFLNTINDAKGLVDGGASALQTLSDAIAGARELAQQGANQTISQQDRDAMADTIDQILNQALGLANTRIQERYIFSGTKTNVSPYSIDSISGQEYSVYNGNSSELNLSVAFGVDFEATLPGPDVFQEDSRGVTEFSGNTGAVAGSGQDTGTGNDTLLITHGTTTYSGATGIAVGTSSASGDTIIGPLGAHTIVVDNAAKTLKLDNGQLISYTGSETNLEVTNENGDKVFVNTTSISGSGTLNITSTGFLSLDGGASQTAIDYSSNQKVIDSVTGQLVNVNSSNIRKTGSEYLTFNGTFDLFTVLKNLRDDLRNTRSLDASDQIESIADRIDQLKSVHNQVLKSLTVLGGRSGQLDRLSTQLETTDNETAKLVSSVQDADIALAITEYTRAQAALEYSQAITARVLQVSLVNFLS